MGTTPQSPRHRFFLLQILRARPASSLRARTVSQSAFSLSCPILASGCSPPAFFNPRPHSGHRFAGHTHAGSRELSGVSNKGTRHSNEAALLHNAWRQRVIPFPVFGLLPAATTVPYAPLTHAWLARQKAGRRPWPCGDQRRSSRTAGLQQQKKKNLTRQRATVFSWNQRMQQGELERCQISNTGLPLFSKQRQGNNMANSPPENFHRRCSPRAPIPHPSARLCVGPERWRCMHRQALRALRRTALQRQCPTPTSAVARDMFTRHWAACISLSVMR